jgi:hypothetical protein
MGKVEVVKVRGRDRIVEDLKAILQSLNVVVDYEEEEEGGVVYRYEVLQVTGYADNVYVIVRCDHLNCHVVAPVYPFLVESCHCKPRSAEVVECVSKVVTETKKIESIVEGLQSRAQELAQYGFEVIKVKDGAEAYWNKIGETTVNYITVYLKPRISILKLHIEAEPAKIIEIAKTLVKLVE